MQTMIPDGWMQYIIRHVSNNKNNINDITDITYFNATVLLYSSDYE